MNFTLLLAFSLADASSYLHALLLYNKPDHRRYLTDFKLVKMSHYEAVVQALGSIRSLSRTDGVRLIKKYGTLKGVVKANDYSEFFNLKGLGK